tara:strand:- start:118 stop:345 length:228 start_codon:yes stop_codon:yes gene_type:complete
MYHSKKKKPKVMMMGGKPVVKMPGGGMMKKKDMPMFMYGGKVFKDGGTMLEGILKDPAQAKAAAKNPNVRKQMGM